MKSSPFFLFLSFALLGCASFDPGNNVPQHRTVVSSDDRGIVQIQKFDHMCTKTKFASGTRLFGLIDNRCVAKRKHGLSTEIRNQTPHSHELRLQAYSWTLNKETQLEDLNRQAQEDECILHLAEDLEVRAIQVAEPITSIPIGEAEPIVTQPSAIAPTVPQPPITDRLPATVPDPPASSSGNLVVPEPPRTLETETTSSPVTEQRVPNDPSYGEQWGMKAIDASPAHEIFFGKNGITSDVTIAILDTGIDYDHPDLKANIYADSAGKSGYNFIAGHKDPRDDNGHGTHVAGIAAATWNNSIGVAGVMGRHAKLMALKVLDETGAGRTSTIINGLQYAVEHGASVVNLSLGMRGHSSAMQNAIVEATRSGVTVVIAAGNDSSQLGPEHVESPAIYGGKIDGAITVGAFDATLSRSQYSNFGPDFVELSAPGSRIYSTYKNGQYDYLSGTSMSSPAVTGAAGLTIGLLKSRGIQPNPAAIESLLKEGSLHDTTLYTYFENGNRLNLLNLAKLIEKKYPYQPTLAERSDVLPPPQMKTECGGMQGLACQVFKAVNRERLKHKLGELEPLYNCVSLAESHARNMATGQFFSHTCPLTGSFETRAVSFGLAGTASENLGFGFSTSDQIVEAWMNSADSRSKILNASFRSAGVAIQIDEFGQPFFAQCLSSLAGK